MIYSRNFFSMLLILLLGISLIGCGADDTPEPGEPGEEVVSEKWIDPKDIGKKYSVGEVKVGDTVTLSTGEQHTINEFDDIKVVDGVTILTTLTARPDPDDPNVFFTDRVEKNIVPDGDPIVSISVTEPATAAERARGINFVHRQITAENNVRDYLPILYSIKIDRVLDYNLPIYVEYQGQDRRGLGGGVHRARFITIVRKGHTWAEAIEVIEDDYGATEEIFIQDYGDELPRYEKASVSILPYTEMKKLDLPIKINSYYYILTPEDKLIPEGYKFRPYRIASSSFLMGQIEIEDNW